MSDDDLKPGPDDDDSDDDLEPVNDETKDYGECDGGSESIDDLAAEIRVVLPPELGAMVRRAREAVRHPRIKEALNAIHRSHVQSLFDAVRPQLDAVFASYRPTQKQINELFASVLPRLPDLTRWAQEIVRTYRDHLPANWDLDNWHETVDLMELTGWSLIWVPSQEVLAALIGAATVDEAEKRLVAHEHAVLDDVEQVAALVTAERLVPFANGLRDAVSAARAGAHSAAQALAATLFTSAIHLDQPTLRAAKNEFGTADWMEAPISRLRRYGVWLAAYRALHDYWPERGDPVPTGYNRHATVHGYSPEQYRRPNALAGILLAASYLRELQADQEAATAGEDTGDD